jgi:hypothetical protein
VSPGDFAYMVSAMPLASLLALTFCSGESNMARVQPYGLKGETHHGHHCAAAVGKLLFRSFQASPSTQ